jgi:hypothetical protein
MVIAELVLLGREAIDGQLLIIKSLSAMMEIVARTGFNGITDMDKCCCNDHARAKILCNKKSQLWDSHAFCSCKVDWK